MKVSLAATTIAATLLLSLASSAARAQDFSCSGSLSATERAICSSTTLKDMDERMARLYGWLWEITPGWKREALRDDQRSFLALRNDCESRERCLHKVYQARIRELTSRLAQGPRRPSAEKWYMRG